MTGGNSHTTAFRPAVGFLTLAEMQCRHVSAALRRGSEVQKVAVGKEERWWVSRQTSVCDHRTGSQPAAGRVTHRVGDGGFVCLCVHMYTCVHPPVRLFNIPRDTKSASELELPQDPGVSTPAWLVIRICSWSLEVVGGFSSWRDCTQDLSKVVSKINRFLSSPPWLALAFFVSVR